MPAHSLFHARSVHENVYEFVVNGYGSRQGPSIDSIAQSAPYRVSILTMCLSIVERRTSLYSYNHSQVQ